MLCFTATPYTVHGMENMQKYCTYCILSSKWTGQNQFGFGLVSNVSIYIFSEKQNFYFKCQILLWPKIPYQKLKPICSSVTVQVLDRKIDFRHSNKIQWSVPQFCNTGFAGLSPGCIRKGTWRNTIAHPLVRDCLLWRFLKKRVAESLCLVTCWNLKNGNEYLILFYCLFCLNRLVFVKHFVIHMYVKDYKEIKFY